MSMYFFCLNSNIHTMYTSFDVMLLRYSDLKGKEEMSLFYFSVVGATMRHYDIILSSSDNKSAGPGDQNEKDAKRILKVMDLKIKIYYGYR